MEFSTRFRGAKPERGRVNPESEQIVSTGEWVVSTRLSAIIHVPGERSVIVQGGAHICQVLLDSEGTVNE